MGHTRELETGKSPSIPSLASSWTSSWYCSHTTSILSDEIWPIDTNAERKRPYLHGENQARILK